MIPSLLLPLTPRCLKGRMGLPQRGAGHRGDGGGGLLEAGEGAGKLEAGGLSPSAESRVGTLQPVSLGPHWVPLSSTKALDVVQIGGDPRGPRTLHFHRELQKTSTDSVQGTGRLFPPWDDAGWGRGGERHAETGVETRDGG